MTLVWIGVLLLVAAIAIVLLKKSPAPRQPVARLPSRGVERLKAPEAARPRPDEMPRSAPASPSMPVPVSVPAAEMPPALAAFHLQLADDLPEDRRQAFVAKFKDVPRPPKLLHRLLSPDFVNEASSTQLVELISGEPLIASRVLTTINSPMYGLKSPISSIGQAVTYLGLNTVRVICLRYILTESFKADSPERKQRLDAAWNASALASELTQQLSQRLGFDDRGSLVSIVVLSFLGRLATTASTSADELASIPAQGLLARTVAEQKTLGLCASQVGRLLMIEWDLPANLVDDASAIDPVLVTPAGALDPERGSRLALCFVCARLGERLAEGSLPDLEAFDANAPADAELFHLQGYLASPKLARLAQIVRSADMALAMQRMLSSMRR